ncbi:ABC transporter substrate-binding protein [Reticulibacter mediterranei]|nr:ABC transporter substrate-binding protein [Reticulibacter mediterranei]
MQLAYCSAPQTLDIPILKMLFGLHSEKEAGELWMRYSKFTFVRINEQQKMILHPLVRDLLTQSLLSLSTPGRNYYKVTHSNLREHFAELAVSQNNPEQCQDALVEEAYHALTLGDPEPAITYICTATEKKDERWRADLQAIVQASTKFMPQDSKRAAVNALFQAKLHQRLKDVVTALVLDSWFLHIPGISTVERAEIYYELSEAYRYLPDHHQEDQEIASDYFSKAQMLLRQNLSQEIVSVFRVPIKPFPVRKISKVWRTLRLALVGLLVLASLTSYLFMYYGQYARTFCHPYGVLSPRSVIYSAYFSPDTRVVRADDGECIGISDGSFAFDVTKNHTVEAYKTQAADYFMNGDENNASIYWEKAHDEDPSDAETLIYEENQNVMNLVATEHFSYVTIVVFTMLTSSPQHQRTAPGRDDLRGAYIAQKQQNSNFKTPLIRILIANAGDRAIYAVPVAEQIIEAQKVDKTIVGVIGPPQSRDETVQATKLLGKAHIPVVSAATSSDSFTNISPYFFRASANNSDQVNMAAQYAESRLNAQTAVLFEDPHDNYSANLAEKFVTRFQTQDHHTILKREEYNAKDTENLSNTLAEEINNACTYNPDLIYFSGRADEMLILLNNFPFCGKGNKTKIMAADELDQIISEAGGKFPATAGGRLYYTSFASVHEWDHPSQNQWYPTQFFASYRAIFDVVSQSSGQQIMPNGHVILAYDATMLFLDAITNTVKRTKTVFFRLEELRDSIAAIHGEDAMQGVSGVIDFGAKPTGDPVGKAIVILAVDEQGGVKLAETLNRLHLDAPAENTVHLQGKYPE